MTRDEVRAALRDIIQRTARTPPADWSAITDATMIESFGFDSLYVLDLIYDIQQAFGVELDAAALVSVRTVGDLLTALENSPAAT